MKTKTINFAKEFTDCPGGRSRAFGDFSGEEFRIDYLEPALEKYNNVILNLNGVFSFPSSFIDEAFGILVEKRGLKTVQKQLELRLDDNPIALKSILTAMEGHAS